jgi:hypothetical protein
MDAENSVDHWTTYYAFGMENYKDKPEYIKAQKFWSTIKAELYESYKNDYKVKRFLDNLRVTEFYREKDKSEEDYGAYKVELIIKFGINNHHPRQYSHFYIYLCYDPNAIKRKQKQIKIRDYEWWGVDDYFDDKNDTDDDTTLDNKLYQEFLYEMGWEELNKEDISHIFTLLFSYFSDKIDIKF